MARGPLLAFTASLATPQRAGVDTIETADVRYRTGAGFNIGALGVILILIALYATWW
jgi:SSS family solute:Na+ symporter